PSVRHGENAVGVASLCARMSLSGTRPVDVPFAAKALGRDAGHVAGSPRGQTAELVPHLGRRAIFESTEAPHPRKVRENLPVGASVARGVKQFGTVAD